jgi:hypothetical protein
MQVAGTVVVAQAGPQPENFVQTSSRQPFDRRQVLQEAVVVGKNGSDARLLEHDFGDPDAIRVATCPLRRARAPGKITSVHAKPLQQTALQGAALLVPSFGCPLNQATLYSHELELRNRIPYNIVRRRVLTEHKRLGCVQFWNGCCLRIYDDLYLFG